MIIESKWELGDKVRMKDLGNMEGTINAFHVHRAAPIILLYQVAWADVHGVPQTRYFGEAELEGVAK